MKKIIIGIVWISAIACSKSQYSVMDDSQIFSQGVKYNNKVDVVLMVDNSSSMDTYQNKLAQQAPGMVQALNTFGMDYRLVVVTTDMRPGGNGGLFVGSPQILSPGTPNLANVLTARIKQGTGGSDQERGLESIETALQANSTFLRSDALLALIVLSNEDDHSVNNSQHFAEALDQLKPKFNGYTQAWVLNFIGVPNLQSSCSTALDGIYKEPGIKWIELADYSGGLVQPICDTTLASAVSNIKKRIVEVLTEFSLGRPAVDGTIQVRVNGVLIPESTTNGWEYIPEGNRIKLHGSAVPTSASDVISIDFTPATAS